MLWKYARRQQQQQQPEEEAEEEGEEAEKDANTEGNLWCHMEGCRGTGTYTSYRINIWGLRKPDINRQEGRQMVDQQVRNILRNLNYNLKFNLYASICSLLTYAPM